MSLWSRIINIGRADRVSREIDEELASHIDAATEAGRDPDEARRALGHALQLREASRDVKISIWMEALWRDVRFGWRQLAKNRVTSVAAILSLALAIGSCTSAFRLIDAVLLRPLPVAHPERLYSLARTGIGFDGKPASFDGWAYPSFQLMRAAVADKAELISVSYAVSQDLTFASDQEMEAVNLQYVSGWMFPTFGLRPQLGRLFTENDDRIPHGHPVAVISHDYWTRRFGKDPAIVGRKFRMEDDLYEIVGVASEGFTGTETGTVVDVFVPSMMHAAVLRNDSTWTRTLAHLQPSANAEALRAKLSATSRAFEQERAKGFTGMTKVSIDRFIDQTLVLVPAAAGASGLQQDYRRSLIAVAVLVALVLLIACANVANLLTAQGASRAREMALRVSIGAGRRRLVQLVLVESALLGTFAASLGALFAWWSAPFVVHSIDSPGNRVRLFLPMDWRVWLFGVALTLFVTLLFGLTPALRASAVRPASALKGGVDPHARRRMMHGLIALQVAFCFLVLFVAGLFVATFDNLAHQPLGFSADRILFLHAIATRPQTPVLWEQVAAHLRAQPGVERVAVAGWPLLTRNSINGFVSVNGAPPGPVLAFYLPISPGWIETMKIELIAGRDFTSSDTAPGAAPGSAIVNETFVKQFFGTEPALGKTFLRGKNRYEVVGIAHDAPYRSLREGILPVAYIPLTPLSHADFMVRTSSANPLSLAPLLRQEVPAARSEFRVSNIGTQADLNSAQTVRERLLATLAVFFGGVALLLASVGLYGVLDYSVLQRRREIGIRMALGARAGHIARGVTGELFAMVAAGAVAGLALGLGSVRYIETLFYGVSATDAAILTLPSLAILAAALVAALPAVARAVRIDPAISLRSE